MNQSGSHLLTSRRGVSTVVGYTILVVLIFGSIVILLTVGTDAMVQTQQHSELERAEHSMTLLDSRAAMVALGTSNTQTLSFGQGSGSFDSLPDSGSIVIKHVNYTAGETETVYEGSLGAFVYRNDGTEIAYQGGGVWRKDPRGATRMLSPPEFHYREATLTLPIIRTVGSVNSGTAPYASVSTQGDARKVFPNRTEATGDGTGAPYDLPAGDGRQYLNPLDNGTVEIQVQSVYYEGWASYFRERTTGHVEVFDANQTVHLTLISLHGSLGEFPMPPEDEGVRVSGMGNDHPVTKFELNLSMGNNAKGNSENHWAMFSKDGYNEFEVNVGFVPNKCEAQVSVYYRNTSSGEHEEWQTKWLDSSTSDAVACPGSNMVINLSSDSAKIYYGDIKVSGNSGTKYCFGPEIDKPAETNITLTQHDQDPGSGVNISDGHPEKLNFTMNHYLARLGLDYSLIVSEAQGNFSPQCPGKGNDSGGSQSVSEDESFGILKFKEASGAQFITFLHITENRIEVDLS